MCVAGLPDKCWQRRRRKTDIKKKHHRMTSEARLDCRHCDLNGSLLATLGCTISSRWQEQSVSQPVSQSASAATPQAKSWNGAVSVHRRDRRRAERQVGWKLFISLFLFLLTRESLVLRAVAVTVKTELSRLGSGLMSALDKLWSGDLVFVICPHRPKNLQANHSKIFFSTVTQSQSWPLVKVTLCLDSLARLIGPFDKIAINWRRLVSASLLPAPIHPLSFRCSLVRFRPSRHPSLDLGLDLFLAAFSACSHSRAFSCTSRSSATHTLITKNGFGTTGTTDGPLLVASHQERAHAQL